MTAARAMHQALETFAWEIQTVLRRTDALQDDITAFYLRLGVNLLRPSTVLPIDTVLHALGSGESDAPRRRNSLVGLGFRTPSALGVDGASGPAIASRS